MQTCLYTYQRIKSKQNKVWKMWFDMRFNSHSSAEINWGGHISSYRQRIDCMGEFYIFLQTSYISGIDTRYAGSLDCLHRQCIDTSSGFLSQRHVHTCRRMLNQLNSEYACNLQPRTGSFPYRMNCYAVHGCYTYSLKAHTM